LSQEASPQKSAFQKTARTLKEDKISTNEMPTLHPNPLKSNTPLKIAVPAEWKNSTLFVYDSMGRLIINATLKEGENELLLNVSTGIYYLNIISSNDTFRTKLLVE
jgi:hypothetical protein